MAEVLITLGIIGVVAAMTMPALIQNYRNKVVETRLKKFYTTFNQAILIAESKYGDRKEWYLDASGVELDEDGNPIIETSKIDNWFNTYLSDFIVIKRKSDSSGRILYYLPDGSAFQFGTLLNPSLRDIYFYPNNPEKCIGSSSKEITGICAFSFEYMPTNNNNSWKYLYNKGLEPTKFNWDGTEEMLINDNTRGCKKDSQRNGYCTALIQLNNWTIPKNYPFRVR